MKDITVQRLKQKIDNGETFVLLDVRDPFEQYQANIDYENSLIIPADRLEDHFEEVAGHKNEEVVCMCRSGSRSNEAAELLEEEGFKDVKRLKGGIHKWAEEIDNSMPVY